jgi:hypothetical protein
MPPQFCIFLKGHMIGASPVFLGTLGIPPFHDRGHLVLTAQNRNMLLAGAPLQIIYNES